MGNGKTKLTKPKPSAPQAKSAKELREAAARKGKKSGPAAAGLKQKLAGGAQSKASAAKELQQSQGNARVAATLGAAQQQKEPPALAVETLIKLGVAYVERDARKYGRGQFPDGYYEIISRRLFEHALKLAGGDYDNAIWLLDEAVSTSTDNAFHQAYSREIAPGGPNGTDKVKHFVATAYYQSAGGYVLATNVAIGKEIYDDLKWLVGMHPTGFDAEDVKADLHGMAFGIELEAREKLEEEEREQLERSAGEKSSKGGDLPPPAGKVEQQPAGQTKPPGQPVKIKT